MGYDIRVHYGTHFISKIQYSKVTMKNTVKISAIFIMLTFIILSAPIGRAGGSSHTLQEDISQYFENKSTVCLKLKNSGEITGVITNYNDSGLTLDIGFGTTVIPMKDIKAIAPGKAVKNPTEHSQQENFVRNNKQKENVFKRIEAAERIKQENIKKQNMITDISFKDRSRIHVDALLNGSIDVELLVDTGANLVSIPPHTARRLGIQIRRKNAVPVLLADGSTGEAMPITLRSIKVGNAEAKNVKAIVLIADQGQPQPKGLLGMSFLNNFHLKLDTDKNILTLIKK